MVGMFRVVSVRPEIDGVKPKSIFYPRPNIWLLACLFIMFVVAARVDAEQILPQPKEDDQLYSFLLFDLLEYQGGKGLDQLRWDVVGWAGGDYNRLWFKTEGDTDADKATAEFQLLYGRLIAPFWDLQAGIGHDRIYGSGSAEARTFASACRDWRRTGSMSNPGSPSAKTATFRRGSRWSTICC